MLVPSSEWGKDSLYSTNRKLFISTIRNQVKIVPCLGNLHLYLYNRPISKVEIVGIVTSFDPKAKRTSYHVDDGTGCIRCIKFLDGMEENYYSIKVGQLVSVTGNLELSETNSEEYGFAIRLNTIVALEDSNMESLHILSAIHLNQVYSAPLNS